MKILIDVAYKNDEYSNNSSFSLKLSKSKSSKRPKRNEKSNESVEKERSFMKSLPKKSNALHKMLTVIGGKLRAERNKEKEGLILNKEAALNKYSRASTFYHEQEAQQSITNKTMQSFFNKAINSKDSAKPSKSLAKNMKDKNENKYKIRLSNIGLKSL